MIYTAILKEVNGRKEKDLMVLTTANPHHLATLMTQGTFMATEEELQPDGFLASLCNRATSHIVKAGYFKTEYVWDLEYKKDSNEK